MKDLNPLDTMQIVNYVFPHFGVPYKNRTCNQSLGGTCYIHLTKGTGSKLYHGFGFKIYGFCASQGSGPKFTRDDVTFWLKTKCVHDKAVN